MNPAVRLDRALRDRVPGCNGDARFTEDKLQLRRSTVLLPICAGCPLFIECGEYAETARPPVGFWAGKWRGSASGKPKSKKTKEAAA